MTSTFPPKTVNGSVNTVFNTTDYIPHTDAKYDAKYLPLTGGILTGGLTTSSLTVSNSISTNGILSSSGVNEFDTNITLPTTYTASPNLTLPSNTQLGGFLSAQSTGVAFSTGVVVAITSLQINAGVWLVCWRGSVYPSVAGSATFSNIRLAFSVNNAEINGEVQQRVTINGTQTCTFGATQGYDVSLMGSTIVRPTSTAIPVTYYLNASCTHTGVTSLFRGHIHAVRIG